MPLCHTKPSTEGFSTGVAFLVDMVLYTLSMKTITESGYKEKYEKLYHTHYKLLQKYREEVLDNSEREKRNKQTRWELMMENKRLSELYDSVLEDFRHLMIAFRAVENSKK